MPTRLGPESRRLGPGDVRRMDFVCEVCHFWEYFQRWPETPNDFWICALDRIVTCDIFHQDSVSGAQTNFRNLRQIARWGRDMGVPNMIPATVEELAAQPVEQRQFLWFMADKAAWGAKFDTVRRFRSSLWNYFDRMEGLPSKAIPTASKTYTRALDGLMQRLGVSETQDKVFPTVLLTDLVHLMQTDYERARGPRQLELCLANLALHVYFQLGLRANEPFYETLGGLAEGLVVGAEADTTGEYVQIHCSIQTKEQRYTTTVVLGSYDTVEGCPLGVGYWVEETLEQHARRGLTPTRHGDRLLWQKDGKAWTMGWFWATHVLPRLQQLQREEMGGLGPESDLDQFGSNSPRRTWNTMAALHPNPVSEDLRERQGRWRAKQKRRQRVRQGMASLYMEPTIKERLRATYYLSPIV